MVKNKYPIYVISKGRHESRLTAKALDKIKADYYIVIEPQEYDDYAAVIDKKKIKVLPFSNLGQGSIPARNWVWEHSEKNGDERHWIMDDNLRTFYRLHDNKKIYVATPAILRAAEDYTDRYLNIHMSGLNYDFLVPRKKIKPPFTLNTRIYSCILLKNNIPFRWRGRYNEDTDLSLRILKAGYCTILFNAFLAKKISTMIMKGGNTDELYKQDAKTDGRLLMARSLQRQHPDVTKVAWKWGRWQHQVDYQPFKNNKLRRNPNAVIEKGVNNYGMELKHL